jgi:hypothetical protein
VLFDWRSYLYRRFNHWLRSHVLCIEPTRRRRCAILARHLNEVARALHPTSTICMVQSHADMRRDNNAKKDAVYGVSVSSAPCRDTPSLCHSRRRELRYDAYWLEECLSSWSMCDTSNGRRVATITLGRQPRTSDLWVLVAGRQRR